MFNLLIHIIIVVGAGVELVCHNSLSRTVLGKFILNEQYVIYEYNNNMADNGFKLNEFSVLLVLEQQNYLDH